MNTTPPKDKTPIRVYGEIIDGTIKNPINVKLPPKNYTLTSLPRKIKIDPTNLNPKEIVDKSIYSKTTKIFSSKHGVTPNKKSIIDKLLSNKEYIKDPVKVEELTDSVLENGVLMHGNAMLEDGQKAINNEKDIQEVNITNILTNIGKEVNIKKKPTRTIKRIIKRKIKKEEKNGHKASNIPDYDKMTDDERLMHRNDFILKYDLLRKWHPGLNIQKGIENHDNLRMVHTIYELYLGCIYNEINSNFWRGCLLLTWLGLELFGVYVLGLDTSDFLKQQINLMWAYEPIINEMSKVNFYHVVESWTPFQKLIGLVFGSYVFIIVVKLVLSYVGKKIGHNIEGLTSTVVDFISSMIFAKPKEGTLPPIIINNTGQSQVSSVLSNLGGIHNIPVPQSSSSSFSMATQVNAAQGAIDTINLISGKSHKSKKPATSQAAAQPPRQNRFVTPTY